MSSINSDSGAWLSAGASRKTFVMSNSDFVNAMCRRNPVESFSTPRYKIGANAIRLHDEIAFC